MVYAEEDKMVAKIEKFSHEKDVLDFITLVGKDNLIQVISTTEENRDYYEVWCWNGR